MARLRLFAALIMAALASGCGGPARLYAPPASKVDRPPQRIAVLHSLGNGDMFVAGLEKNLAACGVKSRFLNTKGQLKDHVALVSKKLIASFQADYALEVTAVSSESDQYGPRANYYRVILTDLSQMKEVWGASMSLYLRRIKRSGTELDLADELVWGMAEKGVLAGCPPRPVEEGEE